MPVLGPAIYKPVALAVLLALGVPAQANPTGPRVAAGAAAFNASGKTLTVTNAPGTILNWQSFSIGAGELTRFQQQSAASAVLNRVTGANPSAILGALTSNGRVFLVNPHGIVFGRGAVIDTAGFVASTLNMRDEDFLAGRLRFEGGGQGVLRNEGAIRASGDIFLVGPRIENEGLIRSESGSVLLAAGRSVTITSPDAHGVQFALQAPEDSALNLGTIEAKNAAGMFAGSLRHSGDIRAVSASVDGTGRVTLAAQKDAILDGGATVNADNSAGKGGSVRITGERVGLFDQAAVSARGAAGGGEILVGGGYKGADPDVRNAAMTVVATDASLDASATGAGDGGRVIVWADDTTRAWGSIVARGAPSGGKGGFIETSGRRYLDVSGLRINAGPGGTWLLDPLDIEVVAGNGLVNNGGAPAFTPGGGSSQVGADLIVGQLNANTSVVLDTNQAGSDAGNITVSSPIVKTNNNSASLTLTATNDIHVNADIEIAGTVATTTPMAIFNAGGNFNINDATVKAQNIHVTAGSIQRSGTQATDFIFADASVPGGGKLRLTANTGAVGSAADPIRFTDLQGTSDWAVNTAAAGAAGHIHLHYTGTGGASGVNSLWQGNNTITTDAATAQTVSIRSNAADFTISDGVLSNDHWVYDMAGRFRFQLNAGYLTGSSVQATAAEDIMSSQRGLPDFDTSAANGDITLVTASIGGNTSNGVVYPVRVQPGTGQVYATSTSRSIQLAHHGGDMPLSRYHLTYTGGLQDQWMYLTAADGHLVVDSTPSSAFDAQDWRLTTATAGKDIRFDGGTVTGNRMGMVSAGGIDNLAAGVTGWREVCANAGCHWYMEAAGGIGLANPVRAYADWVGNVQTAGVGAAGDIRITWAGAPRIANWATDAGSAQTHALTGATLVLSQGSPFPGPGYVLANDTININLTGDLQWANSGTTHSAASLTINAGGNIVREAGHGGGNYLFSTSGPMSLTAGGSVGTAANYALIPSAGSMTVNAGTDIYLDAGANPLTLAGLATGAGVGTIGLRTTGANDLIIGGTTNINDNLILDAGRNILFPAAASFSTSGGLTLNKPTQIAATAAVAVTGGAFSASSAIDNAGTLTKANAGTATFSGLFTNSGTLDVNTGTLNLDAGMNQTAGGISIGGGATLRLPPGTTSTWSGGTLTQAAPSSTLRLDDATLTLNANIGNSGTLHLQNFSTLNGSGTVTNSGDVNIFGLLGSPTPVVFAANLVNQGNVQTRDTVRINGGFSNAAGGSFLINDSDTAFANGFTNAGTLQLYSDANYEMPPVLTVTAGTLTNTGTVTTTGTEVRDRTIAARFDNQGTVTTSIGRLVIDKSGAAHANTGTMNAAGANILVQQSGGGSFTHGAGTINAGSGRDFSATGGVFDWQGGALAGSGSFSPSGGLVLSGGGARVLNGPTLNVTDLQIPGGSLELQSGALNLSGITTITAGATLLHGGGTLSATNTIDNAGTLIKNAPGTLAFPAPFNNIGTLDVNAGAVELQSGTSSGTFDAAPGTAIRFVGGTHNLESGALLSGGGNFVYSGGTVRINGDTTVAAGSTLRAENQSFGGLGTATLINRGTLELVDAGVAVNVNNRGVMNVLGLSTVSGDRLDLTSGALNVTGGFTLQKIGGAIYWHGGTIAGAGTILGDFRFDGAGVRELQGAILNAGGAGIGGGSLKVSSGSVNFAGPATIASGVLLEIAGGDFASAMGIDVFGQVRMNGSGSLAAPDVFVFPGGALGGTGRVNGRLANNGTVSPGTSPGRLIVDGNYRQGANGVLNVELGGTTQGVDYDWLEVIGTATLAGTLNVSSFGGFTGTIGDRFAVMSYIGVAGDFTTINVPAGVAMTATPMPSVYLLERGSPAAGVAVGSLLADAAATLPAKDVRVLQDRFFVEVDKEKQPEDEAKKETVLECR